MTRDPSGDINISKIPVEGIGGVALGLTLIAYRHRRARRSALLAGMILGLAIAVAFYLWGRVA